MNPRLFPAALLSLALLLACGVAYAQNAEAGDPLEADTEPEPELGWDDYAIKGYSIEFFGGMFGGDTYLDLPVKGPRTEVEEGSDNVRAYDGTWLQRGSNIEEYYDGPTKVLENGITLGFKVGSYLTENFHLDLVFSYTRSEAVLTMVNSEDEENPVREEISRDDSVQIIRGGLEMVYDIDRFGLVGFHPYFGFGVGGLIHRFSALEDRGELYLVGTFGAKRQLFGNASAFVQFDLTNYSISREELDYNTNMMVTDITVGLSFFMDVVPGDVRAARAAENDGR